MARAPHGPAGSGAAPGPDAARSGGAGWVPCGTVSGARSPQLRCCPGPGSSSPRLCRGGTGAADSSVGTEAGAGPGTTADCERVGVTAVAVPGAHAGLQGPPRKAPS